MPVGEYGEYSPSFIEAVEDYLRSGQRPADMRIAATKVATGTTGPERRDSATKMQKMMAAFLGQAQADPSIIDDFISFQRQKLGDAVASGEGRVPAREVLGNLRDIQELLSEQRAYPESGGEPKTNEELLAKLESPEHQIDRAYALSDVKEDPAAKYTKAVSKDEYYDADKRADQKREEFTEATGLEVALDEDFTAEPPETEAQVAERVKADKMLAETKAAGEKMIKGPVKLDPKTGKPLEPSSGMLKGPDKFDPAKKKKITLAKPEAAEEMTDEGYGRLVEEQRRKEEEDAVLARRKKAGLPPLPPAEAMRVEEEAHAEARRKGFDSLPFDDPIWLGQQKSPDAEDVFAPDMEGMLESIKESSATDMPEPEPLDTNPDPARAEALPISEDDQALRLFRVAHGGDFDPKSSLDKRKIDKIRQLLVQQGGQGDMTDNQFALKLYRQ